MREKLLETIAEFRDSLADGDEEQRADTRLTTDVISDGLAEYGVRIESERDLELALALINEVTSLLDTFCEVAEVPEVLKNQMSLLVGYYCESLVDLRDRDDTAHD